MKKLTDEIPQPRRVDDSWDATFALRSNREILVSHFNLIAGPPSYAMTVLQEEFLEGRMDSRETIAFAKVCQGLVGTANDANNFPT